MADAPSELSSQRAQHRGFHGKHSGDQTEFRSGVAGSSFREDRSATAH
jgi:hypothetical protein